MAQRARVESEYKVPKEKSRVRLVELIDPAIEYLRQQFAGAGKLPAVTVDVMQRDNVTKKRENVKFVFRNGVSGEPWHASSAGRWIPRTPGAWRAWCRRWWDSDGNGAALSGIESAVLP